jgi:hypothetical protein
MMLEEQCYFCQQPIDHFGIPGEDSPNFPYRERFHPKQAANDQREET